MKKILETLREKWAEYLLEIIVIIAGILGAFFLDSWNDQRIEYRQLAIHLKTIRSDLELDTLDLEKRIKEGIGRLEFWNTLLKNPDNDSLAHLYIKNITGFSMPSNSAGYISLTNEGQIGLISNLEFKSHLIHYYGEDFADGQSLVGVLNHFAQNLTDRVFEQSILVTSENTFGKRMTTLLEDPSFVELTRSFMRLYTTVLDSLEERKSKAIELMQEVESN